VQNRRWKNICQNYGRVKKNYGESCVGTSQIRKIWHDFR
jgi:hypothetical protein